MTPGPWRDQAPVAPKTIPFREPSPSKPAEVDNILHPAKVSVVALRSVAPRALRSKKPPTEVLVPLAVFNVSAANCAGPRAHRLSTSPLALEKKRGPARNQL